MTTSDLIPSELEAAAKYLGQQKMTLPSGGGDSRGDSSAGESTVIQVLQNAQQWNIVGRNVGTSTNRAPYDMEFEGLLVDVKISSLTGADNTNAKSAIFYLLTGETNHPTHTKRFWEELRDRETPDEQRDFYYLIVNKSNTSDVFVVSMKHIAEVILNPSNQPFQANWENCRHPVNRTWQEAKQYLLGMWAKSLHRQAELRNQGMPTYYPEIFSQYKTTGG